MFRIVLVGLVASIVIITNALAQEVHVPGTVFTDCEECPEMVVVPAGAFLMGSPPSEQGRDDDEGPVHEVVIGQPFAAGKYEITVAQYRRFIRATRHQTNGRCGEQERMPVMFDSFGGGAPRRYNWSSPGFRQRGENPVVCVNWYDAVAYTDWLTQETGEPYRLLSEAEWEYAARAGTQTPFYWGEQADHESANYKEEGGRDRWDDRTAPTGSFPPNAFGLYDMAGNAPEWVQDCKYPGYEGAPSDGSAWEAQDCETRSIRGGSWRSNPEAIRSANRYGAEVDVNVFGYFIGFRVARDLESLAQESPQPEPTQ